MGSMPRVRNDIYTATFEPHSVRMLGEIFDEIWADVVSEFGTDANAIVDSRIRLATIILELAKDGQLGRHQIIRTASRLIRQARTGNGDEQAA